MRLLLVGVLSLLLAPVLLAQRQPYAPSELQRVFIVEGTQSVPMRDNVASRKGSWQVVVSKQSFVFKGRKAALRTRTTIPEFQFETDPDVAGSVYLFRLDGHSDRREIRVARGPGGLTEMSIPRDHIIETRFEEIGKGESSTTRYRLKPVTPLPPGEYCLSRSISICYDFGVD